MAEIHLCAMATHGGPGGPQLPKSHYARLRDKIWPGGGTVKELVLSIGDSTISVWPADPDKIDRLGDQLKAIAREMRVVEPVESGE